MDTGSDKPRTFGVLASLVAVLSTALLLFSACASQPYWENDRWAASMFQSVEAALNYPADADPQAQAVGATVQFTYADGKLQDAEIMKSSGSQVVDAAILQQIVDARVPAPSGPQSDIPHRFQMDVHMTTPLDTYLAAMQRAISVVARYPLGDGPGKAMVGYDYFGGKLNNVKVTQSSHSKRLDEAALDAIRRADLPQTPEALKAITHFEVGMCFGDSRFCGKTQTVIRVVNDPRTTPTNTP